MSNEKLKKRQRQERRFNPDYDDKRFRRIDPRREVVEDRDWKQDLEDEWGDE